MEYTVKQLARLSGQTPRTIRHYDEIGLLPPQRVASNGYRIYGAVQVDRLQQILFYRELGFALDHIGQVLDSPNFNMEQSLAEHIEKLIQQKNHIEAMIVQAQQTLQHRKEHTPMTDQEKFKAFQQKLVQDNEAQYGREIRQKYGEPAVERSNKQFMNMSQQDYEDFRALESQIHDTLGRAMEQGNPAGELAQQVCALHKQWITQAWGHYDAEAHKGLVEMYTQDERFATYYENGAGKGAADFLLKAMEHYLQKP